MPTESEKPPGASSRRKAHRIAEGDFAAVIRDYIASPDFQTGLKLTSQRLYRHILRLAGDADTLGALSVHVIRPALVQGFLDGLADKPGLQKAARGVLAAVEKWALVRDRLTVPIIRGTYVTGGDEGGHDPWPDSWIDLALRHARPDLARVVMLAFHTGQRGSDIVRMRFSDIEEQTDPLTGSRHIAIPVKRTHTVGRRLWIPCTAELLATIATWERKPPFYLVLNPFSGEQYTREKLSYHWHTEKHTNPHLAPLAEGGAVIHGLRASCVIRLRNRGATSLQIESMIGMSRPMVERYSRHADQNAMAIAAVHHLDFGGTAFERRSPIEKSVTAPPPRHPERNDAWARLPRRILGQRRWSFRRSTNLKREQNARIQISTNVYMRAGRF